MPTSFSPALAHLRELQRLGISILVGWGARIATWLVAGNASALVLTFNAALNGANCDRDALALALWLFAIGGGIAFLGAAVSYLLAQWTLGFVNEIVTLLNVVEMNTIDLDRLEAEFGAQPEENALQTSIDEKLAKFPEIEAKAKRLKQMQIALLIPFFVSFGLFAWGVLLPVLDGGTLLSTCAAHSPA